MTPVLKLYFFGGGHVTAGVRGTMESNPYETPPIDKSLAPTPQVVPAIWSIPIDIIGSWAPFGMVTLLFLPSLHELPKASLGRLVFELSVIVIAITIGTFVTLKRLVILAKRLTTRSCRTKISDA